MDVQAVTAYGAAFASPAQTAGVLRARAAAAGLETRPSTERDLLAAVLGAHVWLSALQVPSLADSKDPHATAALAAIYCRAGGRAAHPVPTDPADPAVNDLADHLADEITHVRVETLPQETLAAVQTAVDWVHRHGGDRSVLVAAALDLSAGFGHPTLAAVGDALLTLAHQPS